MMTRVRASWITLNAATSLSRISAPESPGPVRLSNSSSVMNAMPLFGEAVKPFGERPGKATDEATPGTFLAMSLMRRTTASVRSSDAASGSWATQMRYCLSCSGMNPTGTRLKTLPVSSTSPRYTTRATALARITRRTPFAYFADDQVKKRLNGRNNQPSAPSMPRVSRSFFAPCPCNKIAQSAGESVRELNAEMTVEMAMVMANCL